MVILEYTNDGKVQFNCDETFELVEIKNSLKVFDPNALNSPRLRSNKWDGMVRFYNMTKRTFDHGLIKMVTAHLKKSKIRFVVIGRTNTEVGKLKFKKAFMSEDRDYQRKAVRIFLKFERGILKIPTRGGKTFIAAEILRQILKMHSKTKFLFMTESADIFNQNSSEIANFLGKKESEMGRIREKLNDPRQLTTAMIQTLHHKLKIIPKEEYAYKLHEKIRKSTIEYLRTIDFIVVDEIHEFLSSERRKILSYCKNARWILGLSATPFKKNSLINSLKIQGLIGPILMDITEQSLVDRKVLANSRVGCVMMTHNFEQGTYQELLKTNIIHNNNRNTIILTIIEVCMKLNKKLLVMFSSVEHGKVISEATGIHFLYGGHDDMEREEAKRDFLTGKGNCLLVSNIWKKGITLPSVEVFLNASGGKEDTSLLQKRGRVLGTTSSKSKALAFDILDNCNKYFNQHSLERLKTYEEQIGGDKIDFFESEDWDFDKQLENYIKSWFIND